MEFLFPSISIKPIFRFPFSVLGPKAYQKAYVQQRGNFTNLSFRPLHYTTGTLISLIIQLKHHLVNCQFMHITS